MLKIDKSTLPNRQAGQGSSLRPSQKKKVAASSESAPLSASEEVTLEEEILQANPDLTPEELAEHLELA